MRLNWICLGWWPMAALDDGRTNNGRKERKISNCQLSKPGGLNRSEWNPQGRCSIGHNSITSHLDWYTKWLHLINWKLCVARRYKHEMEMLNVLRLRLRPLLCMCRCVTESMYIYFFVICWFFIFSTDFCPVRNLPGHSRASSTFKQQNNLNV